MKISVTIEAQKNKLITSFETESFGFEDSAWNKMTAEDQYKIIEYECVRLKNCTWIVTEVNVI